jgi:hypothetical protein
MQLCNNTVYAIMGVKNLKNVTPNTKTLGPAVFQAS